LQIASGDRGFSPLTCHPLAPSAEVLERFDGRPSAGLEATGAIRVGTRRIACGCSFESARVRRFVRNAGEHPARLRQKLAVIRESDRHGTLRVRFGCASAEESRILSCGG